MYNHQGYICINFLQNQKYLWGVPTQINTQQIALSINLIAKGISNEHILMRVHIYYGMVKEN